MEVRGWLVAEVEARPRGFGGPDGGRLLLFRTATNWSLLQVSYQTSWDADSDLPVDGWAYVWSETYASLAELKAGMGRGIWSSEAWWELVKAGAKNPPHDELLRRLWAPVRIDLDLERSSIYRPEYAAPGAGRQEMAWQADALVVAVDRLEELGFVVLEQTTNAIDLFPRQLITDWSNPVVGAVKAAAHGYSVRLMVAVDDAGEIYTRSGDSRFDPGAPRHYPPRPLTRREARQVEEVYRQRRAEARRQSEEES
jgi:hypothetical protein